MVRLVDSFEVQRLRRIKQLGLALFTYQGAEHSRFAHSLGALHLMTRVLDRLSERYKISEEARAAARAAALLHDTGHGPFSHVMEKVLNFHHEEWPRRAQRGDRGRPGPQGVLARAAARRGLDHRGHVPARLPRAARLVAARRRP